MSTPSSAQSSVAALRPHWRAVRVVVLGATSLLLATSAHTFGGGDLPAPGVLAVTAIVLGLLAVPSDRTSLQDRPTAGRPRSAANVAAPVVSSAAAHPTCEPAPGCRPRLINWAPHVACTGAVLMSVQSADADERAKHDADGHAREPPVGR